MGFYEELSKEMSYALRHAPWEYELEMDEAGWVLARQLIDGLHREAKWRQIDERDLQEVIRGSEKKRFELKDGRIRAFYGHSVPMKIVREEKKPPDLLYHGTARRFLESIKSKGLLPQSRQYVHLSQDRETAEQVGKRHDGKPCILTVDAGRAWQEGVKFYLGNEKVWLADYVDSRYLIPDSSRQNVQESSFCSFR